LCQQPFVWFSAAARGGEAPARTFPPKAGCQKESERAFELLGFPKGHCPLVRKVLFAVREKYLVHAGTKALPAMDASGGHISFRRREKYGKERRRGLRPPDPEPSSLLAPAPPCRAEGTLRAPSAVEAAAATGHRLFQSAARKKRAC